jgi:hypothetical protein
MEESERRRVLSAVCHALFALGGPAADGLHVGRHHGDDRRALRSRRRFTLVAWARYVFVILRSPSRRFTAAVATGTAELDGAVVLELHQSVGTGLSDIVPVTAHARAVVMIEQLAGLGYVALFVSVRG